MTVEEKVKQKIAELNISITRCENSAIYAFSHREAIEWQESAKQLRATQDLLQDLLDE